MHGFLIIRIVFLNFGINCELTYFFTGLYATTALIPKFLMYLSLSFFVSRRWGLVFHACSCSIAVGDEIIIIIRVLKDRVSNYMVITDFNPIWRDFYNLTYFTMHWHVFQGKELQTGFQEGMARMLGPYANHTAESSQENAMAADLQADEGQDEARDRYQRSFWEPVAEDEVSRMDRCRVLKCRAN